MHILSVSLNYQQTPVQIRERFALAEDQLTDALLKLRHSKSVLECIIVATCNRTEIYAVVDQLHTGRYYIKTFLAEWFNVEKGDFESHLDIKENGDAIQYMFEVPVGLQSMVLGETQILGQVKDAFFTAQETGTTGTIFNQLFQHIIATAKRAHAETEIGQNAVSVSYAAIELGKKIFGRLDQKAVLILGAGKMSELTAKHLTSNGVKKVYVANRTLSRAEELAQRFSGKAYELSQIDQCLKHVDIVISSTGSKEYVLTKSDIEQVMSKRQDHPLFLIDIAVPRDLDPAIHDVENAFLYDIDDLNGIVEANLQERQLEAQKISRMIEQEIVEFEKWVQTLGVIPMITALRKKALSIQEETLESILNKCPDLDEREIKVIKKHTKSIINQLLRDPITRVKELAAEKDSKESLELFSQIFALEQELLEQEQLQKQEAEEKERKLREEIEKRSILSRRANAKNLPQHT